MAFYKDQSLLIYVAACSGLYLPSLEKLNKNVIIVKLLKYSAFVPLIGLTVLVYSSFKHLVWDESNSVLKTIDITLVSNYSLPLFKVWYHNLNRRKFEKIFELWDSSFQEDLFSEIRERMFVQKKKMTDRYTKIFQVLCVTGAFLWSIQPIFNENKKLSHPSGLPYRNTSPDYELMVTWELFMILYYAAINTSFDALMMVLLSMVEVQLVFSQLSLALIIAQTEVNSLGEIRTAQTKNLLDEFNFADLKRAIERNDINISSTDVNKVRQQVRIWIKHHQQLIKFHEEMRKIYYVPLCFEFSNIVLSLCLVAFSNITKAFTTMQNFVSIAYNSFQFSLFYITCHLGDSVNDISSDMFGEAFSKAWYVYPKQLTSVFHIISMRSSKPLTLVAFDIFPFNSRGFLIIFKTSYSFFTFLYQTMNQTRHH